MRIKEVEELVGITKKNIRFYEKEGLLTPGRELDNSYRDYTEDDVRRLRIIRLLRKLDMPINSISDVLEHRISLREALHLHSLLLEEQRSGIVNAQRVCRMISEEGETLADLETERYLGELQRAEEKGTALVNLKVKDTVSKYRESVIVSAVIVAMLLLFAAFLLYLNSSEALPTAMLIYFAVFIVVILVGVAAALRSRIKEIRGGEENDLSKY